MKLVFACLLAGSGWLLTAGAPPKPATLCQAGETPVFSFKTNGGKTATLCRGPKGNYLVYRFGTAAKVELQYPAVLDASSWRKFTYWSYTRGGGASNEGVENSQLSFENGGVNYVIIDETRAFYDKNHEEDYRREVVIYVKIKSKIIPIEGNMTSVVGELSKVQNDHKVKVDVDRQ